MRWKAADDVIRRASPQIDTQAQGPGGKCCPELAKSEDRLKVYEAHLATEPFR